LPDATPPPDPIFTVGHSTRTLDGLVDVLRAHRISVLVDIRAIRRSRANPQFDERSLAAALGRRGIRYEVLPLLGGFRHRLSDRTDSTACEEITACRI